MKKLTYLNPVRFDYNPRAGAHYTVNGHHYNVGQLLETVVKVEHGFNSEIPATSFDEASDIPELNASVKSSGFSLACVYGESKESIIAEYFSRVKSTMWIYVSMIDETIYEYRMNKTEFAEFLEQFGYLTKETGMNCYKVRGKHESIKMLRWLDERV
jgi:hypothetical protein